MTKPAMFATGAVLVVAGGALALLLEAKGWIHLIPRSQVQPFQVPGDPPVTVGDGSLHAESKKYGWITDADGGKTIKPNTRDNGTTGQLHKGCGLKNSAGTLASAILWTDEDKVYDISPANGTDLKVTIQHDSINAPANASNITITIASGQLLQIQTQDGKFENERAGSHNRLHTRPGEVEQIVTSGALNDVTWVPSTNKPHYTLAFCYY